jgi:hypothetical protein
VKLGVLIKACGKIALSVLCAGLFYTGWMAFAIPGLKSGPVFVKVICWLTAPPATAAGFAAGIVIVERLAGDKRGSFVHVFLWPLTACAAGALAVFFFGPMLIVFAMFAAGTASVIVREALQPKKTPTPTT